MKKLILSFILFTSVFISFAQDSKTIYWVNGSGNWNDNSHWSYTDGGASGAELPNSNTNVVFSSNSGSNIVISIKREVTALNLYATGTNIKFKGKKNILIYGSLSADENINFEEFTGDILFLGDTKNSIDIKNKLNSDIYFSGKTGTWNLKSALQTNKNIYIKGGNFNSKANTIESNAFELIGSNIKSIDLVGSDIKVQKSEFLYSQDVASQMQHFAMPQQMFKSSTTRGNDDMTMEITKEPICNAESPNPIEKSKNKATITIKFKTQVFLRVIDMTAPQPEIVKQGIFNSDVVIEDLIQGHSYIIDGTYPGFTNPFKTINFLPSTLAPTPIQVDISIVDGTPKCYLGNDLKLHMEATGGMINNYTYKWQRWSMSGPEIFATTQTSPEIGLGEYVAIATDPNGCQGTKGFTYSPETDLGVKPIKIGEKEIKNSCSNDTNGEVIVKNVTGGRKNTAIFAKNGYGYALVKEGDPEPIFPDGYQADSIFTNKAGATKYKLYVADGVECKIIEDIEIDTVSAPHIKQTLSEYEVCSSEEFYLISGVTVSNKESILWETGGDGTFEDATVANPKYILGENDKTTDKVTLTVKAIANGQCVDISKDIILNITPKPQISIEPTDNICGSKTTYIPKIVGGTVTKNVTKVTWTVKSGAGTFGNGQQTEEVSVAPYLPTYACTIFTNLCFNRVRTD